MFCGKGFAWKRDRKRHLKSHHRDDALDHGDLSENDVKSTSCDYCDETFERSDYLTRHLKNKHAWCA